MTDVKSVKRRWWLGAFFAFIVPFAFYLPTVYPTYCFFSDSGDFIASGELLMPPHPTGYPWFCMLGKLFAMIFPFGEVAWRYGFLTMLFVPLTSLVTFLLLMELTDNVPISVATSWAVAFGATLWYGSVAAEVYSSNLFLTMLTLYKIVKYWRTGDKRWFYSAGLTVGFGAAHHLTLPLMVVGGLVAFFVAWLWLPRRPSFQDWLVAFLLACLPLTYYAYLPIRAPKPYGYRMWQLTGDDPAKSFKDFVKYVLGLRFRYMMGVTPISQYPKRFVDWFRQGTYEYTLLFVTGMLFGWLAILRFPIFWFVTFGMWLVHLIFYLGYGVPDIVYFYIPAWTITVLWGGLAAFCLWDLSRHFHGLLATAILALVFVSPELSIANAAPMVWQTDKFRGRRYLETILADTPKNAALLVSIDDVLFNLWAIQAVESKRTDVLVVSVYQWQPTLLFMRKVVSTTADVYRFFNPYPWHLRPIKPWLAEFTELPPIETVKQCKEHSLPTPIVHSSKLVVPPDGLHIGTMIFAEVEMCVNGKDALNWGYLWLICRQGVPITDETGPSAQSWGWWWFYQPLLPADENRRELFRLKVALPLVSNAVPGYFEVRGMPYPRTAPLPNFAAQMQQLWNQASHLGVVEGWGR
ncbi:MAG: protein O-mannosyl-transferase family [Armatimonadota bacterium]